MALLEFLPDTNLHLVRTLVRGRCQKALGLVIARFVHPLLTAVHIRRALLLWDYTDSVGTLICGNIHDIYDSRGSH